MKPSYASVLMKASKPNIQWNLSNHDNTNHTHNSMLLPKLECINRGSNKHCNENTKKSLINLITLTHQGPEKQNP